MLWVYCKMVFLEFIEEYEYLLSKNRVFATHTHDIVSYLSAGKRLMAIARGLIERTLAAMRPVSCSSSQSVIAINILKI
jgi:hypothetical protein